MSKQLSENVTNTPKYRKILLLFDNNMLRKTIHTLITIVLKIPKITISKIEPFFNWFIKNYLENSNNLQYYLSITEHYI